MSHKVLVVDDEPATVEMIGTFMEINGYEWASAYSGEASKVMFSSMKPDLMILDLMMPDIQGFEICEWVRKQTTNDVPILIVSARTDDESKARAFACGANAYLTKPFDLHELLSTVEQLVS